MKFTRLAGYAGIALGLSGLLFLAGCEQKKTAEAAKPPTLFQFEDYMDPPFLAEYKKKYNETPAVAIYADEDEAFAKMRAGYKPDVMGPCFYEFPRWKEAGLIQPIDTAKLKNWNKVSETLRNLPGISAGGSKVWFVPQYWGNTSITFRTDLAPEYVDKPSWEILFDPKYKGRVSVLDGVDDTVPFIAHMMGIDAYNMTEEQWGKVQEKLKELVKQVRMVSSDDTALSQGLASGEIVAAMTWRITYSTLHKEGKPVAYMNPPGGMFTYVCGLVMNKNTADVDKATALIDSGLSDEAADYTINHIGDEPSNETILAKLPNSTFENLGLSRDVETFLKSGIFQQRLKDKDKIINAWTEIRAGL
ncbi:MAG TPA: extracellular solute-binding protein [Rhizomicrobium sp.]|jgi:spermidine/putrescine transport system substrate-binding protein|nr:extracellular solute-binding protein [Rhizomicrobium sp.]